MCILISALTMLVCMVGQAKEPICVEHEARIKFLEAENAMLKRSVQALNDKLAKGGPAKRAVAPGPRARAAGIQLSDALQLHEDDPKWWTDPKRLLVQARIRQAASILDPTVSVQAWLKRNRAFAGKDVSWELRLKRIYGIRTNPRSAYLQKLQQIDETINEFLTAKGAKAIQDRRPDPINFAQKLASKLPPTNPFVQRFKQLRSEAELWKKRIGSGWVDVWAELPSTHSISPFRVRVRFVSTKSLNLARDKHGRPRLDQFVIASGKISRIMAFPSPESNSREIVKLEAVILDGAIRRIPNADKSTKRKQPPPPRGRSAPPRRRSVPAGQQLREQAQRRVDEANRRLREMREKK